jgi:hypothetical protein
MGASCKFVSVLLGVTVSALFSQGALAQGNSGKSHNLNPGIIDKIKPQIPQVQVPGKTQKLEIRKCPYVDLGIDRLELRKLSEVPEGFIISIVAHLSSTGSYPPYARDSFVVEFYTGNSYSRGQFMIDPEHLVGNALSVSTEPFTVPAGSDGTRTAAVSARVKRGARARPTDQDCNPTNDTRTISRDEVTRILLTR